MDTLAPVFVFSGWKILVFGYHSGYRCVIRRFSIDGLAPSSLLAVGRLALISTPGSLLWVSKPRLPSIQEPDRIGLLYVWNRLFLAVSPLRASDEEIDLLDLFVAAWVLRVS